MTVSRALRGDPSVRADLKRRVLQSARELHYGSNPLVSAFMAHLRATRNTKGKANLAWITDASLDIKWHKEFFASARARAEGKGFTLDPIDLSREKLSSTRLESVLQARGVIGVIVDILNFSTFADIDKTKFEVVTIGRILRNLDVNRVISDEFYNVMLACQTLHAKGYSRIGLFLNRYLDIATESHYLGAFLAFQELLPKRQRVPPSIVSDPRHYALERYFWEWYDLHQPEVILCQSREVLEWVERRGIRIADEIQLAHLSIAPDVADWAGINVHQQDIGTMAVDLLTNSLYVQNLEGPKVRHDVYLRGHWVDGKTLGTPASPQSGKIRVSPQTVALAANNLKVDLILPPSTQLKK